MMKTKSTKVLAVVLAVAIFATVAPMTAFAAVLPPVLPQTHSSELATRREAVEAVWSALWAESGTPSCSIEQVCDYAVQQKWVGGDGQGNYCWEDVITEPELFQLVYNVKGQYGITCFTEEWQQFLGHPVARDGSAILSGTPDWATRAVNTLYNHAVWRANAEGDGRAWESVCKYCFVGEGSQADYGRVVEFVYSFLTIDTSLPGGM